MTVQALRHSAQAVKLDGRRLRSLRRVRGWSQVELAKAAGISQAHVSMFENGQRYNSELSTVGKLARALQVRPVDLLSGVHRTDDLPEFANYVAQKFPDDPRLQRALLAAYELFNAEYEHTPGLATPV